MSKRVGSTKILKSSEIAEILGVTVQSISNFRREGMPYYSFDGVGYLYNFTAIKWFIMFKGQGIYENRRYKSIRKHIILLESKNKVIQEVLNNDVCPLSEEEVREYVSRYNKNRESIKYWINNL